MANEWIPDRLPEDIEAERALLSTCCSPGMERDAADVAVRLREDDFVLPAHRAIFRSMALLIENRLEINALTLKDALDRAGELGRVGDYSGLVEILMGDEVRDPHVLADILIRKRKLRELIRIGAQLVRKSAAEDDSPENLSDVASQELFVLAQGQEKRGLEKISKVMHDSYQDLQNRLEGQGSSGLMVGFSRLDDLTQGFQPGNLVVLAARPGVGKTAMALNWALRASMRHGAHCAVFSLEMSKKEVADRFLSSHSRIDLKTVARGRIFPEDHKRLVAAGEEINNLPIFVCDSAAITARDITAMVDRHCTVFNQRLDMVIVDYLQLISSPQDSRGARLTEAVRVGEISRQMKILAKEHNIPVVVLSQLNREVERREGRMPQLSDLRDSGAIEQDADIVMFIHRRPKIPVGDPDEHGNRGAFDHELIIAKHRNGPTGSIQLYFEGQFSLFYEMNIDGSAF
jgi:replicative DNA helicase